MQRMYKDLVHFRTALRDAQERGDRSTVNALGFFMESYMNMHLDPLLDGEWQSRHPELWGLDADLRLAKADVLIRMNDTSRAKKTLDEIAFKIAYIELNAESSFMDEYTSSTFLPHTDLALFPAVEELVETARKRRE